MAERLTEKHKISCFEYDLVNFEHKVKEFNDYDAFYAYNMAVRKLGELEDILEKYGIKGAKELDVRLDKTMLEWRKEVDKDFKDMIKSDRDTWKRACELACEELDIYASKEDDNMSTANYFYQQAKKEGNDETD